MIDYLPAHVDRSPGESLESWLDRIADANSLPVRLLLPPNLPIQHLARLLDRSVAELNAMTWAGYHRSVVGRARQRTPTWRADRHQWICPRCTSTTSAPRRVEWQLALHPICRCCSCYLVQADYSHPRDIDVHPSVLDMVTQLMDLTTTAWTNRNHADRLRRVRRTTTLIAQSLDEGWPPRHVPVPAIDPSAARLWAEHTAPDPLVAVTLLAATAPLAPTQLARLIEDGWVRIGANPDVPISWLPKRPFTVPPPPRLRHPLEPDKKRLKNLRDELRRLQAWFGLGAQHVPATLFVGTEYPLPHHHEWVYREFNAVALVMLLARVDAIQASQYLHVPYAADPALTSLEGNSSIRPDHATLLRTATRKLIREGLTDYQRRRQALTAQRRLPTPILAQLRLPQAADPTISTERLALGWLWITLTRSTLTSSPWPLNSTQAALDFGQHVLDGEQRLILLEYGNELLTLASDDADRDTPKTTQQPLRQAR